jgi:HTH-type transcriptional regulator/antitoxin HipB
MAFSPSFLPSYSDRNVLSERWASLPCLRIAQGTCPPCGRLDSERRFRVSSEPGLRASFRRRPHGGGIQLQGAEASAPAPNQADVARALGRHRPFSSNLESGQRRLDVIELLGLADEIGFDPHELIRELKHIAKG